MRHLTRFAVAALAATALLLVPTSASASTTRGGVATPANWTSHPWTTDGCSAAPDRGPGWDFHHACVHHDGCYRGHWAGRRTCDDWFGRDLHASCAVLHPSGFARWPCDGLATIYVTAVRLFGAAAYRQRAVTTPTR